VLTIITASKSSAAIVMKLLWKPFDAFFETTLEELRFHADLVRDEIIIEQLNTSTCHNRMSLEEQARAAQDRIASAEAREVAKHNEFLTSESMRLQDKRNEGRELKSSFDFPSSILLLTIA
jgi:hypothetical protein